MRNSAKTSIVIRDYDTENTDINGMHILFIYKCHNCGNLANTSTEMLNQISGMPSQSLVKGYCKWCAPIEEQKEDFKLLYNLKSNKENSKAL